MIRKLSIAVLLWGSSLPLAAACSHPEESVTPTVAERELTAQAIDADPLAMLPGGFIALLRVEIQPALGSALGPALMSISQQLAPLPASAGFRIDQNLERVVIGLYSMQGVDLAGVATGTFDEKAIANAASQPTTGPAGGALVKSPYGGRTLYTVNNVGFCILTGKTALFGNETGMRRALDRLREGRATRHLPEWTAELLDSSRAPVGFGADLRIDAVSESLRRQAPFLSALDAVRVLGNYQPPGFNLAGSLDYATPEAASAGAASMLAAKQSLSQGATLMQLFGVPQPIDRLEARADARQVQFVAALDGPGVAKLLTLALPLLGGSTVSGGVLPAQLSPGTGG